MSTLSTPYKHLQRRAEREDDAALSSYNDSLAAALDGEHIETAAAAKASRLAAGAAARSEMQRRALAAKRARALDVAAAGQSAPPWAWLPALPAHLPAAAMSQTLASSLQRSPHYHPSNCDTMLGEVGACPLIVQAQRREAARELAVGAWEAGLQGRAEAEDAAAFAGAAAAREALLDAVAASEREGRRAEQQQLAATREKEVSNRVPCVRQQQVGAASAHWHFSHTTRAHTHALP